MDKDNMELMVNTAVPKAILKLAVNIPFFICLIFYGDYRILVCTNRSRYIEHLMKEVSFVWKL